MFFFSLLFCFCWASKLLAAGWETVSADHTFCSEVGSPSQDPSECVHLHKIPWHPLTNTSRGLSCCGRHHHKGILLKWQRFLSKLMLREGERADRGMFFLKAAKCFSWCFLFCPMFCFWQASKLSPSSYPDAKLHIKFPCPKRLQWKMLFENNYANI